MTNIPPANDELALWHWDINKSTTIYFYVCTWDCVAQQSKYTEKWGGEKKRFSSCFFFVLFFPERCGRVLTANSYYGNWSSPRHIHISPSWLLFCYIADPIYARKCQGLISITWSLAFHLPSSIQKEKKAFVTHYHFNSWTLAQFHSFFWPENDSHSRNKMETKEGGRCARNKRIEIFICLSFFFYDIFLTGECGKFLADCQERARQKKKKNKITKNFHRTPAKEKGSCVPDIESGCWKSPRNSFQVDSTQPLQTYSVYRLYFMKFFFFHAEFFRSISKTKKFVFKKRFLFCFCFCFWSK